MFASTNSPNFCKIICGTILMLLAQSGNAADVWHTAQIKWIYPLADGDVIIAFHTDAAACTSPNTPKYHYVAIGENGVTAEGRKNIYAAAMLAFSLGKPLSINFSDSGGSCVINRAFVSD